MQHFFFFFSNSSFGNLLHNHACNSLGEQGDRTKHIGDVDSISILKQAGKNLYK
jgi:hypothetical protein